MSKNPKDKIEFRVFGAGGSAVGIFPICVFAVLVIIACITIAFVCTKVGPVGMTVMARIRGP